MSELKLRRIRLRNWMTVRDAVVEFPEKGLVVVLGNNPASGGKMQSVGSGKTGMGEALARALAGVSGRYSNLGHYSTDSEGDMYVCVDTELQGKPFVVEMGYKCDELSRTGEGLRFTRGSESAVERGHVKETRQEIVSALHVTPELAEWTVYIDGDRLRFNRMSERDAVGLLMCALRQPSWEDINKRVAKMVADARMTVQQHRGVLEHVKGDITVNSYDIEQAKRDLEAEKRKIAALEKEMKEQATKVQTDIEAHGAAVAKHMAAMTKLKKRIKELEDACAAAYGEAEKKKLDLQTQITELQMTRSRQTEQRAVHATKRQTLTEKLNEMKSVPANCPTCGKAWNKAHGEAEIAAQQAKIDTETGAIREIVDVVAKIDAQIAAIRKQMSDIDSSNAGKSKHEESVGLSYQYEEHERHVQEANQSMGKLQLRLQTLSHGPDKSSINRCAAILAERTNKAATLKTNLEKTSAELAEAEELVKVLSYWAEAFGPTGIPNLILSEAIRPLNDIAKRVSTLMTGGTIEVVYDTSRQLQSGKMSNELVVNVRNKIGSKRLDGSSKGEAGLTNLIIAETIAEVGSVSNRVGFRWYDEVLNSQDAVVRQSILSYLKDMAARLGILVFVVDHHPEAANYADYVLVAEKTREGTTYHWRQ